MTIMMQGTSVSGKGGIRLRVRKLGLESHASGFGKRDLQPQNASTTPGLFDKLKTHVV